MDYRFEVIERRAAYRRHFRLDELKLRHRCFAGGWSDVLDRELIDRGEAAAVIPYDPLRDAYVMIEQFRVGAMGYGHSPWLLEFVAGLVGPDEPHEEVARREAKEEAGLTLLEVVPVGRYFMSPGGSTERLHLFCARVAVDGIGGIHGLEEEGEDIRVCVVSRAQALKLLADGTPLPIWVAFGIQWVEANLTMLRRRWSSPNNAPSA